jgi:histidine ammonia-lyase
MKVKIGKGRKLSTSDLVSISEKDCTLVFSNGTKKLVSASRRVVEKCVADKKIIYGVTTGFGNFKDKLISSNDLDELQINLIRSHACGVGSYFTTEEVRAMLLVRLNSLIKGYSGVRYEFVTFVKDLINARITPLVPSQGSVGASGDLAPLCHTVSPRLRYLYVRLYAHRKGIAR